MNLMAKRFFRILCGAVVLCVCVSVLARLLGILLHFICKTMKILSTIKNGQTAVCRKKNQRKRCLFVVVARKKKINKRKIAMIAIVLSVCFPFVNKHCFFSIVVTILLVTVVYFS